MELNQMQVFEHQLNYQEEGMITGDHMVMVSLECQERLCLDEEQGLIGWQLLLQVQ